MGWGIVGEVLLGGVPGAVDAATGSHAEQAAETVVSAFADDIEKNGWTRLGQLVASNPLYTQGKILGAVTVSLVKNGDLDFKKDVIGPVAENIEADKALSPYAQVVVSVVPGIGQGASAAIGGAVAIATGAPIDDASIEAAISALPGGALVQSVARMAYHLARSIANGTIKRDAMAVAVDTARGSLKNDLERAAFDFVLALVLGQSIQKAAVSAGKRYSDEHGGGMLGSAAIGAADDVLDGKRIDKAVLSRGSSVVGAAILSQARMRYPDQADLFDKGASAVDIAGKVTKDGKSFLDQIRGERDASKVKAALAGFHVASNVAETNTALLGKSWHSVEVHRKIIALHLTPRVGRRPAQVHHPAHPPAHRHHPFLASRVPYVAAAGAGFGWLVFGGPAAVLLGGGTGMLVDVFRHRKWR